MWMSRAFRSTTLISAISADSLRAGQAFRWGLPRSHCDRRQTKLRLPRRRCLPLRAPADTGKRRSTMQASIRISTWVNLLRRARWGAGMAGGSMCGVCTNRRGMRLRRASGLWVRRRVAFRVPAGGRVQRRLLLHPAGRAGSGESAGCSGVHESPRDALRRVLGAWVVQLAAFRAHEGRGGYGG